MRIALLSTLIVALVSLCQVTAVDAQPPGRGPSGFGGFAGNGNWLGLLRVPSVQREIDLVPDQLEEIESLQTEMWEEMQAEMAEIRGQDLGVEERRERFQSIRESMQERQIQYQEKISKVLLPMQLKRIKELHLQSQSRGKGDGAMGILRNEELLEEIGVDEDQRKKLEDKAEEVIKELEEKIKKLRREAEEEILSVLTSDQLKKFRDKVGETFDFSAGNDGGGRGGFQGFDRGGRGRAQRQGQSREEAETDG
jgi:hypothetical protein